jgi:alpha-L-rhamnosidase
MKLGVEKNIITKKKKAVYNYVISFTILIVLSLSFGSIPKAEAQNSQINPDLFIHNWPAHWIAPPHVSLTAFGVYHFRRDFNLQKKTQKFIIHVSADNRYKLYVNGNLVSEGPAKGDLAHWRFETVDIASYLHTGHNVIASTVWNYGRYRPASFQSNATAFLLQADDSVNAVVNTDSKWKVTRDTSYNEVPINRRKLHAYFAVGPGLKIDGSKYPWQWKQIDINDSGWQKPVVLRNAVTRRGNHAGIFRGWQLVPREIPAMEHKKLRMGGIVRENGMKHINSHFLKGRPVTIPAHKHISLLIDQGYETTTFPVLKVSGGKGATIKVTYAEALFNKNGKKGNRDDINGKHLIGFGDTFVADGGQNRTFSTLWWRTYRYIKMDIRTGDQPLQLKDYFGWYTAFPFKEKASFTSSDSGLHKIWNVGWRTVQLCSHETYMDCPYYEQMQYDGDTRIEGLVSTYVSGNPELFRKAIMLFNDSRLPDGLTQARYPANNQQLIPPFSLFWVAMVHDYWMYTGDTTLVRQMLTPVHGVMDYFEHHLDNNNMLGPLPRWEFADWSFKDRGQPAGAVTGNSSVITLQYVYALQMAEQMSSALGYQGTADHYKKIARKMKSAVYKLCWDNQKGLLADTPQKKEFSQHANVMAVLDHMFNAQQSRTVMNKVLSDTSLIQTTYYYHFYLFQALRESGMGNELISTLKPWYHMLDLGLSTFAETPEPTRSDCHGWSSSPLYEVMTTIAGIRPATPGFSKVTIQPHPGKLKWLKTKMPTPKGNISLSLKFESGKINGTVTLPEGESGSFNWHGQSINIHSGTQNIMLN